VIAVSPDRIVSLDAESNGLADRAFAVALTLSDASGELDHAVYRCGIGDTPIDPWVAENVIPHLTAVPENCADYPQLLAQVATTILRFGGKAVPLIAHVAWPVEARLLLDVYPGGHVWDGPYPLIDVASVLLAKGHDPLTVDGYLAAHNLPKPDGNPHHPLYDARAAERCYRHVMAMPTDHGAVEAALDAVAENGAHW
jgi:hypothetical protein